METHHASQENDDGTANLTMSSIGERQTFTFRDVEQKSGAIAALMKKARQEASRLMRATAASSSFIR